MITQADINKILKELNTVLENVDKRLTALEEQSTKPSAPVKKKEPVQS
jgi:hypothetical protein